MFRFKQFTIEQDACAMKVGTDGVLLGAWAVLPPPANGTGAGARQVPEVLDVGTGTGIIALMMAQRYGEARVTGIDIDGAAVQQATDNCRRSPFAERMTMVAGRVQDMGREHEGRYRAIVSNPPFFIESLAAPDAQRNVARHTDTLSYADLMQAAWRLLADDGELSVVVPFDYRRRMEDEATFRGFFPSRVCAVSTAAHKPARRFLLAFRKHPCAGHRESMTIGDACYTVLTRDFYL